MALFKCKMCGGNLEIQENVTVCECEYCGSKQTVPSADNDKKINLFTRANRLRMSCEFDKAFGVYESIVADFQEEPEAYWGLILCKYGIEYVDDPKTGKKIPTCHRSSFNSIMDDPNFEMVMEYSDMLSRTLYREEAKVIEELRIRINEISAKEEPYDIFICYKETSEDGQRTIDSVIAQDVYEALIEKGYKVFFSRITLEDKLGQEYEPYIFAALNSAKVMLAFGTNYEYYNAVWVKNEWSRFLELIERGEKKTLIPCYKEIDAYDMPKEFAKLQAQDMGKVGAIQDLVRGVGKILGTNTNVIVNTNDGNGDIEETVSEKVQQKLDEIKEKDRQLKRKKRKIIISLISVTVIPLIIYFVINLVIPEIKLYRRYSQAVDMINNGNYIDGYESLIALNGYKDSTEKAESVYNKYRVEQIIHSKKGDYVRYGAYEQDTEVYNGKEEIEWLVLDVKDESALLISKYGIDCKMYNNTIVGDVMWENCSLREWLNKEFINAAFTKDESALISTTIIPSEKYSNEDKIFLLSVDEVNKYFNSENERKCKPTKYACENGALDFWWLRTHGSYQQSAAYVDYFGTVNEDGTCYVDKEIAVRPAMWIELSE